MDLIRGWTLLSMVCYHLVWDLVYLFGFEWKWYLSKTGFLWQQSICWTFIFLSGFCLPLGKSGNRRGWTVFACGVLVSGITILAMPENRVVFGVLTLIGSCMLLLRSSEHLLERIPPNIGFVAGWMMFFLTKNISEGYLGFGEKILLVLPKSWYRNLMTAYLGLPNRGFYSTDYFPLFPWIFLFAAGYFFCLLLRRRGIRWELRAVRLPFVEWMGRHSLIIYLLHQPILYGILLVGFSLLR